MTCMRVIFIFNQKQILRSMPRPIPDQDYGAFYHHYVSLAQGEDALQALIHSLIELDDFLAAIPTSKGDYAYAPGKWTVKQLLQHMIDTERVFAYRAMCIARGEKQLLPGFDENEYAAYATAAHINLEELKEELLLMREATIRMYKGFTSEAFLRKGTASGKTITVNALGFIIVGHVLHHMDILHKYYLEG
jgi:hypothetical protein